MSRECSSCRTAGPFPSTWQLDGSRLILTGKSMGNGNSSLFTATSTIDSLSRNTLILNTDGTREVYTRMADTDGR